MEKAPRYALFTTLCPPGGLEQPRDFACCAESGKKVLHDDQWYSKLRNGGPRKSKRDLAQKASQATMSHSEARLTRLRRAMPSSATT
jgi:hypothetical protein